ncbi:MAG: transglutaminase domain-containing protein, partial [Planctomycetota bacterium]|nr:transglutaminase domain-containing protein [Planctomycetota bacterium]
IEIEDSGRSTYRIVSQPDAPLRQAIDADENDPRFLEGPIRELTDQVLADAGLARDETAAATESDRAIAERIESWLQLNFEYTVEMVAPSPGEDPIEMFLFRTRRGHCEYFASAMAAMCRSVGLDARVVTGYVASEYDPVSGEFTVRESDAHAWVEAEIDEGHWATFDPSPPSDLAVVHERPDSILWRLRKLWDRMERVWVKSVVAFDEEKREAIVGETVIDATKRVQSRGLEMMRMSARERRSQFFSALAIGLAAFAGVAGAGFLARGGLSALQTWIERRRELQEAEEIDPTLAARLRQAGFYDEFLAESRRAGLARAKWEAPMAHAERLREIDRPLGDSARQLVRLYFDLRWGRRLLSEAEVERARRLVEAARERLAARRSGGAADDEAQTPSVG